MPKKTRKQKIASLARKQEMLLKQLSKSETKPIKTASEKRTEAPPQHETKTPTFAHEDQYKDSKNYFIRDFRKSLILIVFVIALEILIYFGTINTYLRLGD